MERPHRPREERHCVIWDAEVRLPGRAPLKTRLFEASRSGIRVKVDQPVEIGQILPIQIYHRPGESVMARIAVMRCTKVAAGYFVAGAKLVSMSPPDRRSMEAALQEQEDAAKKSHALRRRIHPFRLWRLFAG